MEASAENRNRYTALGFTIGIHSGLLLLFFLIAFVTPPPPPALALEWDNGTVSAGNSPEKPILSSAATASVSKPAEDLVQDPDEPETFLRSGPADQQELKDPSENISDELSNALSAAKAKRGNAITGNDAITNSTGKEKTGTPFSAGPGTGLLNLTGRTLISKPGRLTDAKEEGVIVVQIVVDAKGNVIRATPGQRGSTTLNAGLQAKAQQAALALKFNESADEINEQRGTYSVVFTLE